MSPLSPLRTGAALALTVAVLYLACIILVALSPGTLLAIFSTIVHGIDIEPLTRTSPPLDLGRALLGLAILTGYTFVAGALYGWARRLFSP